MKSASEKDLDDIEMMDLLSATEASYMDQGDDTNRSKLNRIQREIFLFTKSIETENAMTNRRMVSGYGAKSYKSKMPKTREFEGYKSRIDEEDDISAFMGDLQKNDYAVPYVQTKKHEKHKKAGDIPHSEFSSHDDFMASLSSKSHCKKPKSSLIQPDKYFDDDEFLAQFIKGSNSKKIENTKAEESEIDELLKEFEENKKIKYVHKIPNVICGLMNPANYCYRNSIIQCLVSNTTMVQKIKTQLENGSAGYVSGFDKFVAEISTQMDSKDRIDLNTLFPGNTCLKYDNTTYTDSHGNFLTQNDPNEYLHAMLEDNGVIADFMRCNTSFVRRIENKYGKVPESSEDGVSFNRQFESPKIVTHCAKGSIDQKSLNHITTEIIENSLGTGDVRITSTYKILSYPPFFCVQTSGKRKIPVTEGFSVTEVSENHPESDPLLSRYELTSCVMRSGKPCGDDFKARINLSGHYVACVKKNNEWFVLVIIFPIS